MAFSYADPAVAAFVVIPALLVAALVWMAVTWIAAESGRLRLWDRNPPPFGLLLLAIGALAALLALSGFGQRLALFLPLSALVAIQAFRLPLELAMHGMYERGIMPVQMSYSGRCGGSPPPSPPSGAQPCLILPAVT